MATNRPEGVCHICGNTLPLTYEHVPPRSAFNDEPADIFNYLDWASRDEAGNMSGGTRQQRGWGAFTLCQDCNSNTGSWYVPALSTFVRAGLSVLIQLTPDEVANQRSGQGATVEFVDTYPLRFLKQVVTMLLSANGPEFGRRNPDLVSFVLNREQQGLPERYDFFLSFFRGPMGRMVGLSARFDGTGTSLLSEIAYPPFSYLMTIDTQNPILPAGNISHVANYAYDEMATIRLNMVVGFGHTPFPGDFRSMADIESDRESADRE